MLSVGILEYRLPRDIFRQELTIVEKLGINVKFNTRIGRDINTSTLKEDFKAIFIAPGAQLSQKIYIEGAELEWVLYGVEFLRDVNLDQEAHCR